MRLLLWTVVVGACAVHGGEVTVLLGTLALLGCASDHGLTRRRARAKARPFVG